NPSPEVLDAVASALRLDDAERQHLLDLFERRRPRKAPPVAQRVRPSLLLTLQSLDGVPAFIFGRRTDVLAANRLAREVLTDFEARPAAERNLARYVLLDPQAPERMHEGERAASDTVAMLRFDAGRHPEDRRLSDLIGELTMRCPDFGRWWDEHHVMVRTHGVKRYRHPLVGDLEFHYEAFPAPGDPEQTMCVYNVEPGSATAEALRLLESWTSPRAAEREPRRGADLPVRARPGSQHAGRDRTGRGRTVFRVDREHTEERPWTNDPGPAPTSPISRGGSPSSPAPTAAWVS